MTLPAGRLRVVTPAHWLADDFAAAAPPGMQVIHDFGLDVGEGAATDLWWCPMGFGARLLASGVDPGFTAPGPGFTARLDRALLRRRVAAFPLERLAEIQPAWAGRPVHAKLAEAKRQALPAQVWSRLDDFVAVATETTIPPDAWIQLSDPVELVEEVRCFILNRQVVAASVYLRDGMTWDGLDPALDTSWARRFAATAVSRIGDQPPAYTLDVGLLPAGVPVVVEANPAWSSNPYHCDMAAVLQCVAAAQGVRSSRWRWRPDPAIVSRKFPLPVRRG